MANQWDWVPREALDPTQQATLNRYCSGAYIDAWQPLSQNHTELEADLIFRDSRGHVHLSGAAQIRQPESTLAAQTIVGQPDRYYRATGDVSVRGPGQLIRSQEGYVAEANSTEPTTFTEAQFLTHQTGLRGEAKLLAQQSDGVIFIEDGFYTTCEPGGSNWQLYGSSIELDPNSGFGTAKHVQVRIDGNPIFYFPWLRFPIDSRRQSGFLFPSFSYNSDEGVSVSAPYYLNLAPNFDATLTPHWRENYESGAGFVLNGYGADLEVRHLSPFGSSLFEQSTFYYAQEEEGSLRKFTSTQKLNSAITVGTLLEDNPTPNITPDMNTTSIGEKDNYERSFYGDASFGNFSTRATVKRYYTPDEKLDQPLEWKPRVEASYRYANTFLNYAPTAQLTEFYDPDETAIDGRRRVLNQDISVVANNAWGELKLGVLHQFRDYQLNNYKTDSRSKEEVDHLTYYLDTGIVFERSFLLQDSIWRQTLEPKLTYVNAPYLEQSNIPNFDASETTLTYNQAFAHQRFSGNDRVGDTRQVAIGVESRFYDGNNVERWTLKAGQLFYLHDRRVDLTGDTGDVVDDDPRSSILTSASYRQSDVFRFSANVNYDADLEQVDLAQTTMKYTPENGVVVNLGFSYVFDEDPDSVTRQSDLATIVPLSANWHLFHQQTYDWTAEQETKKVTGLGFENCCLKMSFSYQYWLNDSSQYDSGLFLNFILRSLSGVGRTNSETSIANDYWNNGQVGY